MSTSTHDRFHPLPFFPGCLLLLTIVAITGCGTSTPGLSKVTGTVTLDGQPLADASVAFNPHISGMSSSGRTDTNGRFTLQFSSKHNGAMVGSYKVMIMKERQPADNEKIRDPRQLQLIPFKYSYDTTLTAEVKEGSNTIDFPLASDT